jgi:hypothetical protein
MVVGESDGQIVAFGAWLPWRLRVAGEAIEAMRGVDFGVHPSHRGHGLQVQLIKFAQERFPAEVALTFSTPNEISRRGALRAGRGRVGRLRHFVRPKHPMRAAARVVSDASPSEDDRPPVDAQSAANALADAEGVASLVKAVAVPSDRLTTACSLDYLRWRYGGFGGYHAVRVESRGELAGLAVFRLARRKAWMSSVCELLVRDEDRGVSKELLDQVGAAADVDLVYCAFRSRRAATQYGFVPFPVGLVLVVRSHGELPIDLSQRSSWGLSIGDAELF